MAFVVEDGTGLSNANSYVSVADANSYHEDRGNDRWAGATTEQKQEALVCATDYLDSQFRFLGYKGSEDQALAWPRGGVFDREGYQVDDEAVPVQIERATSELALASLDAVLLPNSPDRAEIQSKSRSAGGISFSTTYLLHRNHPVFHKAFALMRDLIAGDTLLRS